MNARLCILLVPIALFPSGSQAAPSFAGTRSALMETHADGRIRIHYDTVGDHAVDGADRNGNGMPDQVEDVAAQVRAAWLLWIDGLGFPDPFRSPRYEAAAFLDVHLLSRETLGSNGLAYDELQRFNRPGDPPGTRTLCFDVATSVKAAENLTPAHELFHIIQNGATFFKNRWYTEGTARWSERALGKGGIGGGLRASWPAKESVLGRLDGMAYEAAAQFWDPLALSVDKRGEIPPQRVPTELKEMRYVDGSPVLEDLELHGWEVVRDILVELGRADGRAAEERRLVGWPEAEQKSPLNTPHILRAVEAVLARRD